MTATSEVAQAPTWTLGDRLRKAREFAGLSQMELADAFGISRNTIGNYEADKTRPTRLVLEAWSRQCAVPMQWLLIGGWMTDTSHHRAFAMAS